MNTVEKIARIIDPETFDLIEHYNGLETCAGPGSEESTFRAYPQLKEARDLAFKKAGEIAMLGAPVPGTGGVIRNLERMKVLEDGTGIGVIAYADESELITDLALTYVGGDSKLAVDKLEELKKEFIGKPISDWARL